MVEEEIMSASTYAGVADSEDTTREAKAAAIQLLRLHEAKSQRGTLF